MTIFAYNSTDASAPSLTGQVGSLTTLLDAILVNGYGSRAAAGWSIVYTGTNQRVYQAPSGNKMLLAIDDTNPAPASYGANYARASSYETMTAVTTGSHPIPTPQQIITLSMTGVGAPIYKSSTADATARPWMCRASATFVHFIDYPANSITQGYGTLTGNANGSGFMFGDLVAQQKSGDAYATILVANYINAVYGYTGAALQGNTAGVTQGHWLQRPYTQFGSGINCGKGAVSRGISTPTLLSADTAAPNYPDPITGGIELAEIWVYEPIGTLYACRGKIPGLYSMVHSAATLTGAFNPGDTFPGAGTYAGNTYEVIPYGQATFAALQTSGTWS